jgi:hypothetical protein
MLAQAAETTPARPLLRLPAKIVTLAFSHLSDLLAGCRNSSQAPLRGGRARSSKVILADLRFRMLARAAETTPAHSLLRVPAKIVTPAWQSDFFVRARRCRNNNSPARHPRIASRKPMTNACSASPELRCCRSNHTTLSSLHTHQSGDHLTKPRAAIRTTEIVPLTTPGPKSWPKRLSHTNTPTVHPQASAETIALKCTE